MARIFLIEDEVDVAIMIADILTDEGHTVGCHASGKGGWEEAKRFEPDLIVLDLMLPDMTGDRVAEQIRAVHALRLVPIIVMSARETARADATRIGACSCLEKPFDIATLLDAVDRAIYKT